MVTSQTEIHQIGNSARQHGRKRPTTTESDLSSKGSSDHGTSPTNNKVHASRGVMYRNDTDGSHFLSRSDAMEDSLRIKVRRNVYDRAGLSSSQISSYQDSDDIIESLEFSKHKFDCTPATAKINSDKLKDEDFPASMLSPPSGSINFSE